MSGYWVVEVAQRGKTWLASERWQPEPARFENQADAEELADEIVADHERAVRYAEKLLMSPPSLRTASVRFIDEEGD